MTPFDFLETGLLDLLYELRDTQIRLILGGGYGLYLKTRFIEATKPHTLIRAFPEARSTDDLNIFLHTEILADAEQARTVRAAFERLGYHVKPGAEFYQFVTDKVKIDLLTGPEKLFDVGTVRIESGKDGRRVKPKKKGIGLHARSTNEAVTLQEELVKIQVTGYRSSGDEYTASIQLPHPYTYATMKLFSIRDKEMRGDPDNASKHAIDLYRIIAMMMEEEWETAQRLSRANHHEPVVQEAANIAHSYFADEEAPGMLRLREHPLFSLSMNIATFRETLFKLFPE